MKRIVSLILAFAMLIGMLPVLATAEDVTSGSCGENLLWTLSENGTLTISGIGEMTRYYSENAPWYPYIQEITSVHIGEGVTNVSADAFWQAVNLAEVLLPDSLVSIDQGAFSFCTSLTSIHIPENVKTIVDHAFWLCEFTSITLPKGIASIEGAFDGCYDLRDVYYCGTENEWASVTGKDTLTDIELHFEAVFEHTHSCGDWYETKASTYEEEGEERRDCKNCGYYETRATDKLPSDIANNQFGDNLTWTLDANGVLLISGNGSMPEFDSVASAPWYTEQQNISKVIIQSGVTNVGQYAFFGYPNLAEIDLGETVVSLGKYAFTSCDKLKEITIPNGLTSIGQYAFSQSSALEKVIIPDSVTSVGDSAFLGCAKLKTAGPVGTECNIEMGWTSTIPGSAFMYCESLESVTIPATVTEIGICAFYGCTSIKTLVLPNSLTKIGNSAFTNCRSIEELTIPAGVTVIEEHAFQSCESVKKITLGSAVTSIEKYAFASCFVLEEIHISKTVSTIADRAFMYCYKISDVYYDGSKSDWALIQIGTDNEYLLNATIHTKEPVVVLENLYDSVINEYREICAMDLDEFNVQYNEMDYPYLNYHMMWLYHMYGGMQIVYAYYDIDGNGVDELLIGNGTQENETIIGLYAFDGEKAITLNNTVGERASLKIHTDGTIKIQNSESSSSTTTKYYRLDESGYVLTEVAAGNLTEVQDFTWILLENSEETENITGTVWYYSAWDESNQVAYFGPGDKLGSKVTEETDLEFSLNPYDLVGQYVLVNTRPTINGQVGPDILISVKAVESKTGTVSAADAESITIGEETYTTPKNLGSPESYVDQIVVYHLYDGKMVGIEILEEMEGILTYWNKEANAINIKQNADDKDVILYHLSSVADTGTIVFLNTVANQNTNITYLTDCNNLLYNARKPGYRLEITTKDDISTTIEVGKTVTIYASLFYDDESISDWDKPQVLLTQDSSAKIISYGTWQAWPKYNLEISGVKSGKVEMTILDVASNASATVMIEVIPEDPLDGLSHEEWIQKHIDYTNSNAYKEQVVPGFNGILLETYENAKNNKWTSPYRTLDGINKVLGFDGEKLNETQEYELLLAQILFRRTGVTAIEDMYDSFLSDAYVKVLDVLFTSTNNVAGTGNVAGLDDDTIELLDKLCDFVAGSEEFNITLDSILENLAKVDKFEFKLDDFVSGEISFATSIVMDQLEDTIDNMGELVTYLAAGEAYCKTSEAFGKMLLAMRSNINNPALTIPDFGNYNINSPFVGAQLDAAIGNFYTSLESYEKDGGKEIANKALEKYKNDLINSAVDAGLNVAVSILECIPVVKAFSVVRDMFDGTQFLIKTFTSIDEQEYHGTMLIRLYCMEQLHYITVNGYAMNSANWGMVYNPLYEFDPEAQFEHSLLFDESIAVYRAIASVAADYAEQYLAAYYNPVVAGKYGHLPNNYSISGFGALRTQLDYEWCHSPYATFEEYCKANGIVILDSGNMVEYKFKCPVEIIVRNEQESIIAVLRNGNSDIADGYEQYFFTTELEKGSDEYLKVASVPDTYSVSIKGTGAGTMDVYVSTYSNTLVGETRCFLDVPITENTEGYFVDGDETAGAKVLHIEEKTFIGKPMEEVIHVPETEVSSDSNSHWYKCTGCDEKLNLISHSGGTATCTKKAVCTVCGTSYGELASHDYALSWSQGDANGHWHKCKNCSAHDTQVKHTPGSAATETTAQTCTECGYVIAPATGHVTHAADSKWFSDVNSHWHKCTGCNEKLDVTTHSGGTATCTKKAVCAVCGTSYGELAPHDYETTWSQGDANGHWHECKNCSAHDTQVKHIPSSAATATKAQTCTVCGYVITPALGHTCTAGTKWYSNGTYHWHLCTSCGAWVKTSYHSYSSGTDESCNVCGYVRKITTTEPTEETEVVMTETTETIGDGEEVIATETAPTTVSTEANENLSDDAVSENTDSRGVSGVLITVFAIVALGSLAVLVILLVYKKRRKSE